VRDRQDGLPLDVSLDVAVIGHTLGGDGLSLDEVQRMATRLARMLEETPQRQNRGEAENVPPGVFAAAERARGTPENRR